MKLNQIINLHKGLTAFVVIGLMIFFDNFTIASYVYLALHGTYGLLWLLKEKIFPDPYFKENNVFFDSMNYNKGSIAYGKRDNPYSRSNSIYIFPIEVISSN